MRFRLRTLIAIVSCFAIIFGVSRLAIASALQEANEESRILDTCGLNHFVYSKRCVLPSAIARALPDAYRDCWLRVSEIDFQFNDLNRHDAAVMRELSKLNHVRILRIPNPTISRAMLDAICEFPSLELLHVTEHCDADPSDDVDLRKTILDGKQILIELYYG